MKKKSTTQRKKAGRTQKSAQKAGRKKLKTRKRLSGRELINFILDYFQRHTQEDVAYKTIFTALGSTTMPEKQLIVHTLQTLSSQGILTQVETGVYRYNAQGNSVEGIYERRRDYAVVMPDDGSREIIVSDRNNALHALPGDRVRVLQFPIRMRRALTGQIIEILERKRSTYVARVVIAPQGNSYLQTEDRALARPILVTREALNGAQHNDKVVARITHWGPLEPDPSGEVIEVLGPAGDNDTEMHAILCEYDLPFTYPQEAEEAANAIPEEIPADEIAQREDFRSIFTLTIDPADAKDFDDALSWRKLENGNIEVGVHIADVSYYVTPGSAIDREAYQRATSIYLVDRTIPMLPERLCNDLCSLRPDTDRLAYSCIFELNPQAEVLQRRITRTLIRSDRRYAYEEAQFVIDTGGGQDAEAILSMHQLAQQLRHKRFAQGAINFESQEVRFVLDERGVPIDVAQRPHGTANELIEEFMLLANRTVAETFGKKKTTDKGAANTFLYRIHDLPDSEKLSQMAGFIRRFGYTLKNVTDATAISKGLNKVITDSLDKPEASLIQSIAVRTMARAEYSTENIGHYGLAFDYYTHFTSPIRRYPDLIVHRLITHYLEGGSSVPQAEYERYAQHCSEQEQIAAKAERDSIRYKQVEYLSSRIGSIFDGVISNVAEWGLYVELSHSHCEGLIPIRLLDDDYYDFDEKNFALVGRRYRRRFVLGDSIRVRVVRSDFEKRQIDFELID